MVILSKIEVTTNWMIGSPNINNTFPDGDKTNEIIVVSNIFTHNTNQLKRYSNDKCRSKLQTELIRTNVGMPQADVGTYARIVNTKLIN